jgi:hypothetical protein
MPEADHSWGHLAVDDPSLLAWARKKSESAGSMNEVSRRGVRLYRAADTLIQEIRKMLDEDEGDTK